MRTSLEHHMEPTLGFTVGSSKSILHMWVPLCHLQGSISGSWGNEGGSPACHSQLDGLTFLLLWSIDLVLKMSLVLSEGKLFSCYLPLPVSHVHAKYA